MPDYQQALHRISVKTPLGKDKLYLKSFHGQEEFSRLFSYSLDLLSDENWIDPKSIVGKNITVTLQYPDDSERHFNGIVKRFVYQGTGDRFSGYRAEMVPALWMLTRTADCKIFQDMKIPDILKDVFSTHGFTDFKLSLNKSYPQREYCVQYRETAFNFVSRLMEQYGIYYFFQHSDGAHKMVLADDTSAYENCKENSVTYRRNVAGNFDMIASWEHQFEYTPGKWAHTDYNFETPKTDLKAETTTIVDLEKIKDYEIFDYPGEYAKKDEGDAEVELRMQEEEVHHDVVSGTSYCRSFTPGGKFTIKEHLCPSETGKSFVITSITHSATVGDYMTGGDKADLTYHNGFTCVPDSVVTRPARITPKPVVQGSHPAVVVGPPGEEIWPDKYGRVKVQFFWDRYGQKDDKSSCWIRCVQSSAGRNWGFMSIPRIGQEVIVTYLEGDPDRPLISGLVYNADQMPAYTLPDEKTKTYFKSNSSKGGDGHNEIRIEDKAGEEQVYLHAERNMDTRVKNDSLERIFGNRHQIIGYEKDGSKGGDQRELIYQDKHLNVKRDSVEHVEGNMQLMVGNGDADGGVLDVVIEKQERRSVGSDGYHLTVEGDACEKVGGTLSHTIGSDHHEKVGMNHAVEAGMEIHLKAGMKVIIEANLQLSLKVGGSFVNITPAGVDIQGPLVNINSGGAAGSGSGAKPASPEPAEEAAPTEPDLADDTKTGSKSSD